MLLLTTLLGALLVTLAPQSAQAHTPAANPTCTSLDVSATSYGGNVANHVTVVIDGDTVVDQAFGASFVRSFAWDATVDHTWEVTIDQGDGDRYDYHGSGTQTACEQPPSTEAGVPAEPGFHDVCGPEHQLVVPEDTDAYRYAVANDAQDGSGDIVVTATLNPGYVWDGGATEPTTWTFHATDEPCDVPTTVEGAPNVVDRCGPGYDVQLPAVTDADGYAFSVDESGVVDGEGTVVVTATLADGFTWQDGSTEPRTYDFAVTSEPCDTPVTSLASAAVTVTGATCSAPGTASTGQAERASWTVADVPAAGGTATFVAVADQGAAFEAGLPGVSSDLTTRTFTVDVPAADGDLCTIAPPPVQPPTQVTPPTTPQSAPPTLPRTGFDISAILAVGALLALAGATLVVRRVRAEG